MKPTLCNDIHSKLNPSLVAGVCRPTTTTEVAAAIRKAAQLGLAVSVCGGRHAMGGQQFGAGTLLLDLTQLNWIGTLDSKDGIIEAASGVMWPQLIDALHRMQEGCDLLWSIRQKQTGADKLTLGGALAANIHGRGLLMRPIIDDVESFALVNAEGEILECSRSENADWFRLAIGGYGLFGVIASVRLRLAPLRKLRRRVELVPIDQFLPKIGERIREGAVFGDFQFSIDEQSPDFLRRGVFSCYLPADEAEEMTVPRGRLGPDDWKRLMKLAHDDRARGFAEYSSFYLKTDGGVYGSDTHQLSVYVDDYHSGLDHACGAKIPCSEMISELYVRREHLVRFMGEAACMLRAGGVPVIYGTVRLIRRDEESFLPWAKEDYACVIFNLHTEHSPEAIARTAVVFRKLIDLALGCGGSFYLTYHNWARLDQIQRAYPDFGRFLAEKNARDPSARFQSDWWRRFENHRRMSVISAVRLTFFHLRVAKPCELPAENEAGAFGLEHEAKAATDRGASPVRRDEWFKVRMQNSFTRWVKAVRRRKSPAMMAFPGVSLGIPASPAADPTIRAASREGGAALPVLTVGLVREWSRQP
ncbi:FAD-binding oxidoreductase [Akkermansiaceae bacterium]|nr:FAD-binding oxidoreductase [Akkermansiaceae bacterium]